MYTSSNEKKSVHNILQDFIFDSRAQKKLLVVWLQNHYKCGINLKINKQAFQRYVYKLHV